ncbi:hypothetical protein J6590_099774 [Homalodisca vitripennis]|nr:hypothetical protein J6590_099774 [Homalodisca vitripennis]
MNGVGALLQEQMSSSSSPEVVVTILQSYLKVSLLTHMTTTGRSERKSGQERLYPWIQHVKLPINVSHVNYDTSETTPFLQFLAFGRSQFLTSFGL